MSVFESAIKVILKDLTQEAMSVSHRIINSHLPHAEYTTAQVSYRIVCNLINYMEDALKMINEDPDAPLPETFVKVNSGKADPEQVSEPTMHTVDIESGKVSQGSN